MTARWYPLNPVPDDYGGLLPVASEADSKLRRTRFSEGWAGLTVRVFAGAEGFGEFLSNGPMPPVITRHALEVLKPILSECAVVPVDTGEFMTWKGKPVKNPPKLELFAVDPPILSGALDIAKSEIVWLDDEETLILRIARFALRGDAVVRSPIFRLAEDPSTAIVSEAFREAVEKHKLTGLRFHPLNATWEP